MGNNDINPTEVVKSRSNRWMYIENDDDGEVTHICDLLEGRMYNLQRVDNVKALFNTICMMNDLNVTYYEMLKETPKKTLKLFQVKNHIYQLWQAIWAYDEDDAYVEYLKYEGLTPDSARGTNHRLGDHFVVVTEYDQKHGKTATKGGW